MMNREPVKDRFKNKVAIVTGGANGIGLHIARELCKEGAYVTIADMSAEGQQVAAEPGGPGRRGAVCQRRPFPCGGV